jgi:hypothetical protein
MHRPVLHLLVLAIALALAPADEGMSDQPTASNASIWTPPQRRRIVLMRHGDVSYFDAQGQPVTNSDQVVLSDKGRAEADATGAYLKAIGLGQFDRCDIEHATQDR